ncbi:histidine kinase N-terminal 7TM domain-containing protein [Haloarcula onubensis]|uniref:histidine kinase n=1 Tax=Haloarcula onubensis TaxID=2950539 RepID=A0ABU2FPY8_9EURY|nr:histidine kinase N-terminal 7TM domain-containing protein [Halomicroarcula sp. S3CR25-11]MDS0282828.1 ATP-binding protein [Halomicroarcula sp. S3CR25-11]
MANVPWVALGSFASALGSLYVLAQLRTHWEKPGAKWFVATIGTITVWSTGYGAALLVSEPSVRLALEALTWACLLWLGYVFVGFALGYTGRRGTLESPLFRGLAVVPGVLSVLALSNGRAGLLWTDTAVRTTWAGTVVGYTIQPLGYLAIFAAMLFVSFGTMLVFDTVLSYGPLYRREAIAVGLSPVPPGLAVLAWALGIGPAVNLTTLAFLPHLALDTYAFVRSDMFEFHPATRRAGERAAIDDIATPVAIVDVAGRIVNCNPAAEAMLGVEKRAVLTESLDDRIQGDRFRPGEDDDRFGVANGGRRREYKLGQTELTDGGGTRLGYTAVFQDITDEIRRERRLEVLNRFLRHNVRNESVVIQARAELLAETLDGETADHAETIERAVGRLVASGEKARTLSEAGTDEGGLEPVALRALVTDTVDSLSAAYDGTVTVEVPADLTVESQPALLGVVVENLVENALEHVSDARVTVRAAADGDDVALSVSDDGPGVPDHELDVLERGEETALSHGSGMGLWLVDWATTTLGTDLAFDTSDGTTVTVWLPVPDSTVPDASV